MTEPGSAPPRVLNRADRAAPSTIAAASAGSPGCHPCSPRSNRKPRHFLDEQRHAGGALGHAIDHLLRGPRSGQQAVPPMYRHPMGVERERARSFRGASACPMSLANNLQPIFEQLRLALRRQSLHNCRKQSVSIYTRHSRLSLPCGFALQGQKCHWAFLKNTQNRDWTARIVRTAANA